MKAARAFGALLALAAPAPMHAEAVLRIDPAQSAVRFTLAATLHTVTGEGRVLSGTLRFAPEGGAASGAVVVGAASFATGNATRDAKMHEQVLLSARFPEIRFDAERLEVRARSGATAEVTLHGTLELHGARHALSVPAALVRDGGELRIDARFTAPYVAWGLRDVSTFLMRVAKQVEVQLELRGALELSEAGASRAAP